LLLLQLREELGNARENNDLTADETTKLLLENSHLQQVRTEGIRGRAFLSRHYMRVWLIP
jgi:hypothetical protein